ncbi:MAG TPA: phosphoglycolate phosphatase, partial [Prevotella sp.]|nr:phosphoglycolate phosphatase [Candidatus Segatella violae]
MKYIILDFDGTIGDSQALIVRTFQDTMREMGKEVKSAEACANTIGMRLSEAFALLYNSSIEEGEKCAQVYHKIFEENRASLGMKPFPHVIDTIKELHKRGFVLAVASSRGRDSLMGFIHQMDLIDCVSSVVAQEDVV